MRYESEVLYDLMKRDGLLNPSQSNLPYESELKEKYVNDVKGAYPKLIDYCGEWLNYAYENPIGEFPYETLRNVTEATINNVVPYAYKSAILKGRTGYRDIDTGEILESFEEGRNLELVSVKLPVLTTSNEDGTKTNILTTPEDLELRGIGDVKDELNLLTGEVVERIGEIVLNEDITGYQDTNYSTNEYSAFRITSITNMPNGLRNVICDKVKYYPNFNLNWYKQEEFFTTNGNSLFVKILSTKASNFEELRTFLSSSPITIQYEIAESVKTVDLTIVNQDGDTLSKLTPIEGTMNLRTDGTPIKPTFSGEIPVEAITQNLASFIE